MNNTAKETLIYKIYSACLKPVSKILGSGLTRKLQNRTAPAVYFPIISNPKLIMTFFTKNEAEMLEKNILFHKAQGVDGFIVTDHSDLDNSLEIYQKYKEKGWVLEIITDPIKKGESQEDCVDRMIKLARDKYGADWVINNDADEFWVAKTGNLKDEVSKSYRNKILVRSYAMMSQDKGSFLYDTVKILKPFPKRVEQKLVKAEKLSPYSQFVMPMNKVIIRTSDYLMVHAGNHDADMIHTSRCYISKDIEIFHYHIRSAQQFKDKILRLAGLVEKIKAKYGSNTDIGKNIVYYHDRLKQKDFNIDHEYALTIGAACLDLAKKYRLMTIDTRVKDFFKNGRY